MRNETFRPTASRLFAALLLLFPLCALPPRAQTTRAAAINARELDALLDPVFAERIERLHIPGAAISVVNDGRIIS